MDEDSTTGRAALAVRSNHSQATRALLAALLAPGPVPCICGGDCRHDQTDTVIELDD